MRTTIELSDPVYRRLKATAVDRGLRGFSPIVEEALSEYFEVHGSRLTSAIAAARGAWGDEDAAALERERREAWATWQLRPS
jgi:hypothetical protein